MFDNLKSKPLALDMAQLGYKASSSKHNPDVSCIIRNLNNHHRDVFVKKNPNDTFRLIFKDTLINRVVDIVTVKNLEQVKNVLG